MSRDDKMAIAQGALVALFLIFAAAALAQNHPRLPAGITCEMVKAKVAEHGRYVAYAWARLQGYSRQDIAEARKCLN